MDSNERNIYFNRNVAMVYVEEPGFTGYKGFDFNAIDEVEAVLKRDLTKLKEDTNKINLYLSGITDGSINVNQWNLNAHDDNVSISGKLLDLISGIAQNGLNVNQIDLSAVNDSVSVSGALLNIVSGIAKDGLNVNQIDLNWANDSVSISGDLTDMVSGIVKNGINVNQIDLNWENDSVSVSGELLNFVSGMVNNGVNVSQIDLNWENDSVSVSGELLDIIGGVLITGENIPSGLNVYQANLDKDLDNVTVYAEKNSNISNYLPSGNISLFGNILEGNVNRKELYVQNLATGRLYIKYGPLASSGSFNFVLAANSAEDAGDGGSLSDQSYTGIVSASGLGQFKFIGWERS